MIKLIQTSAVEGDPDFAAIRDRINLLMAKRGHVLVNDTGSSTWQFGAGYQSLMRRRTLFKLLRLQGGAFVFAVRDDFLATIPKLASLSWPHHIAVKPHRAVAFKGFEIKRENPDAGILRVDRIIQSLPALDPSLEIKLSDDDAERDAEFDRQLAALR